jgi:hypothetical protein
MSAPSTQAVDDPSQAQAASPSGPAPERAPTRPDGPEPTADQARDGDLDSLPDWARKRMRELGREAKEFRAKFQQVEDAQKSELERTQAERDRLKSDRDTIAAELTALRTEQQVRDAALDAGLKPERLARAYRAVRDDLVFDDAGAATNVKAAVAALKKDAPEWFRSGQGYDGGAAGAEPKTGPDMDRLIRERLGVR